MLFKNLGLIGILFYCLFTFPGNSTPEEGQLSVHNPHLPHIALKRVQDPEPIDRPLGLLVPLHRAEDIAAFKHPIHFIGRQKFSPQVVALFKREDRRDKNQSSVIPFPALEGPARELLTFLKGPVGSHAHNLRLEIESQIQKGVSVMQLVSYYARYAWTISTFTETERDAFNHFTRPYIFRGLSSEKSQESELAPFINVSKEENENPYPESTFERGSSSSLHYEAADQLRTKFRGSCPSKIVVVRPGSGKFGMTFLVRQYLQGVFPVGIPSKPTKVHGVELSPLGFGVHDILHANVDARYRKLRSYFVREAGQYVKSGGQLEDFTETYLPYAIGQHERFMEGLLSLSDLFLARLLPSDKQAYDRAMIGFFFVIHEYPGFSEKHYSENNLEFILSRMIERTRESLSEGDEASNDFLKTSPIDGKSSLSPEQIKKMTFDRFVGDEQTYSALYSLDGTYIWNDPQKSFEEKKKLILPLLKTVTIESSPNFYDVIFELKSGKKQKYTFATLYYRWHNLDDPLALLKMASIPIQKPELPEDREGARKVALETLDRVSGELNRCLDCFAHWGSYFLNQEYGAEDSLKDAYRTSYGEQEVAIRKTLKALKEKAQREQESFDFLL